MLKKYINKTKQMSLLDKASLIVTPNAYKESKLYSVVPSSGAGDMDVVRATTATRVNSAGLIEVVPRNLLTYSNDFTNAAWTTNNATVTANSIISPDGNLNASLINSTSTTESGIFRIPDVNGTNTWSFYAKKGTGRYVFLNTNVPLIAAKFDLQDGVIVGTPSVGAAASIENVGNGWYRCKITSSTSLNRFTIFITNNTTTTDVNSSVGLNFYLYGCQLEQGSTATEYFPTTTRLNIPRIDYTNGSCPSLLVEPQRTNLLQYSEQINTVPWYVSNVSIIANDTTAPNGTLTADKALCASGGSISPNIYYLDTINTTIGQVYKYTFFAKKGSSNFVKMRFSGTAFSTETNSPVFNLNTGVVVSGTGTIENYGNGWYRIGAVSTAVAITGGVVTIDIPSSTNVWPNGSFSGTEFIYLWGAQLEAGSYATSYIPTVASSVTRNADVISKTGISSLIGQTEGTYFIDINLSTRNNFTLSFIRNSDISSYIGFNVFQSVIYAEVVNTTVQAQIAFNNSSTGRFKLLVTYKNNEFKFYANGNLIGTDTSGSVPSCSVLDLYYNFTGNALYYNSVQLYKTTLTDAECIALTTL